MAQAPRFERESFFQAPGADDSAARMASGLADALNKFSGVAQGVGNVAHSLQVKADNASIGAASLDIEEQINFAKGLYPDDIEAFESLANQSANGTLSAMPKRLRGSTQSQVSNAFTKALNDVKLGQHQRFINDGIVLANDTIESATTLGANSARGGDMEAVREARTQMQEVLSPQLFSSKEISAANAKFDKEMSEQAVIGTVLNIADEKGNIAAYQEIQAFEENGVDGTSPDEVKRMANEARGILNTRMTLSNKDADASDKRTKNWQNANSENLLLRATGSDGETDAEVLVAARESFATESITGKQYDAIVTQIKAPNGIDLIESVSDITTMIYDDYSKADVSFWIDQAIIDGQLTKETALELRGENAKRSGLPQSAFALERKQGNSFIKNMLKDTSMFAKYDSDRAARFANAELEYYQRMRSAEEDGFSPIDIAKDITTRYRLQPLTFDAFAAPRYGTKDDTELAEKLTVEALDRGDITQAEADFEIGLLYELEKAKARAAAEKSNAK